VVKDQWSGFSIEECSQESNGEGGLYPATGSFTNRRVFFTHARHSKIPESSWLVNYSGQMFSAQFQKNEKCN
jgi:hypothetical protein